MKRKLSTIIALILTTIMLVGCGESTKPTDVVNNYFKDINKGANSELVKKIVAESISENELSKEGQEAIFNMLTKLEVEVKSETVEGDTAKADLSVKGINLGTVMQSYISKIMTKVFTDPNISEDQIDQLATDLLIESINEATTEDRECTINLEKVDGKWTVLEDESLSKAIFGLTEGDIDNFMSE